MSEVARGRIAGPFKAPPLENFKCSPLALREKTTPGKYRLLHDLSFPHNGESVNANIPEEHSKLKYASIRDAIAVINRYGRCYLAKSDIAEAYRIVPVHPSCYNLLGFKLANEYFYDRCLPMGVSSACKIFERFSSALKFILVSVYKVKHVVKLLDDFLFIGGTEAECRYALESFEHLCSITGVPLAHEKTVGPATSVTFLGVNLDTDSGHASIPVNKVTDYASAIEHTLQTRSLTLRELQSLTGKLNFTCCVITTGRCFLRRLYNSAPKGLSHPRTKVHISDETALDLELWKQFLSQYNGRTLLSFGEVRTSAELHMYSDSSKGGYGATFGDRFLTGQFPASWKAHDIQVLELYPIFLLVNMFREDLSNRAVVFHCDNISVVHALNKQTSRNLGVMKLLRPMVLLLLQNNISFKALHIPGKLNTICDELSRGQVPRETLQRFGLRAQPEPVPCHLRPLNFRLS